MDVNTARELAILAHKDQWRNPNLITSTDCDLYKQNEPTIMGNGCKVVWVYKNTFNVYEPYVNHPIAVADMMDTDELKILAYLHDVIENTEAFLTYTITGDKISYKGVLYDIDMRLNEGLEFMTHNKEMSYIDYIKNIARHKDLSKLKVADIVHNLSSNPSPRAVEKYMKAMSILLASL